MGLTLNQIVSYSNVSKHCNKIIDAANEAKKAANDTWKTTASLQNAVSDLRKSDTLTVNGKKYDKKLNDIRTELNNELNALINLCNEIKSAANSKRNQELNAYYAEQNKK